MPEYVAARAGRGRGRGELLRALAESPVPGYRPGEAQELLRRERARDTRFLTPP